MVELYSCPIAKCEIISDSYNMTDMPEIGGFSVQSSSMLDNDPYSETNGDQVNNVVKGFSYTKVEYKKKEYISIFKVYMKKVLAVITKENPDKVPQFKKDAMAFMKLFMKVKASDIDYYMNESNNPDGYVPWAYWKDESASGPLFMYFSYGLKMKKC